MAMSANMLLRNTSAYYYYVNEECLEIMQQGWWEFSAPLSDEHKKHFDEYLQQYFYYGHPVYQDPRYEEYTDGDLAFEEGSYAIYTSYELRNKAVETLDMYDAKKLQMIALYGDDVDYEEGIEALRKVTGKPVVPCAGEYFKLKCKLAYSIQKYHI